MPKVNILNRAHSSKTFSTRSFSIPKPSRRTILCTLLAWIILLGHAPATIDAQVEESEHPGEQGATFFPQAHLGGTSYDLQHHEGLLYTAVGPRILAYDIRNPREPELAFASPILTGTVFRFALVDQYAIAITAKFIVGSDFQAPISLADALVIIDFSNREQPRLISTLDRLPEKLLALHPDGPSFGDRDSEDPFDNWLGVNDVVASRDFAYLASDQGLMVVDMRSKHHPKLIGHDRERLHISEMELHRGLLVAASIEGLRVFDVQNPSRPRVVAGEEVFENGPFGLNLAELESQRNNDLLGGGVPSADFAAQIAFEDDLAVMSFEGDLLALLDMRDPRQPVWRGMGFFANFLISDIAIMDGQIFGLGSQFLERLEIPDILDEKEEFVFIEDFASLNEVQETIFGSLALADDHVFFSGDDSGLQVMESIGRESPLVSRAFVSTLSSPSGMLVGQDDLILIADQQTGLQIFDWSDPDSPQALSNYWMQNIKDLAIRDQVVFANDQDGDLRLIDIQDPERPRELGQMAPKIFIWSFVLEGRFLYASIEQRESAGHGQDRQGIAVFDVQDPHAAHEIAFLPRSHEGFRGIVKMKAAGDLLFALGRDQLILTDIQNPRQPKHRGIYYLPSGTRNAADLDVQGDQVYIAAGSTGFVVVDVSEPSNPVEVGAYPSRNDAIIAVAAEDERAYMYRGRPPGVDEESFFDRLDGQYGLILNDLSTANQARTIGTYLRNTPWIPQSNFSHNSKKVSIVLDEDRIYLCDSRYGVTLLERLEGPQIFLPVLLRSH